MPASILLVMLGLNLVNPVTESSGYGHNTIFHHTPNDFKYEVFSLLVFTTEIIKSTPKFQTSTDLTALTCFACKHRWLSIADVGLKDYSFTC
jgi:hypothetical protein